MTPEDVKRFEILLDLSAHPGWSILLDEFDFKIDSLKDGFTTFGITSELLAFGQGRISVYRELASLRPILSQALENNKEDEQETTF